MSSLRPSFTNLLFGRASFAAGEEYTRFRYRFSCSILLFSTVITATFHLAVYFEQTRFDPVYLDVSRAYLAAGIVHYALLRGRPRHLRFVAISFATLSCLLHVATLMLNTPDELRVIWFVLNLPGIYLVLGSGAGILVTVLSMITVVAVNPHLPRPYSVDALFTCVLAIAYLSAFFHAFAARSISFHHAMVEANRKLEEMAARDPLTGLFNGRAYYARCDDALKLTRRTGSPFAMLFVDLDHFKRINDTHGHEAGDAVLRAVAGTLRQTMRQSDVVGRIGGEEFSALLPDTDMEGARLLGEKLRQEIEALMPDIGTMRLRITASIGVAEDGPATLAIAEIQGRADQAMYAAKRAGRNRVTCIGEEAAAPPVAEMATSA